MKRITALIALAIIFNVNAQVYNTSYGEYSLYNNTLGNYNSAFGVDALYSNTSENSNSAFGAQSLSSNKGWYNSAAGYQSLFRNDKGEYNSAFGVFSLRENLFGSHNSAFGVISLYYNTSGKNNSAFGYSALSSNASGMDNTAFGHSALLSNLKNFNTAFGNGALDTITKGEQNTGLGHNTRASKKDAKNQTVIGYGTTGQSDNSVTLGNSEVTAVYMGQNSGATVYAAGLNIENTEFTAEDLKKLKGSFLSSVKENNNTGFRLSASAYKDENYGDIGDKAVDLSYSNTKSDTNGASGKYSLAMGLNTTASGEGSTASGSYSTANGSYSTAMGFNTIASDFGSLVIGQYNDALSSVTTDGSADQYNANNTAFVIGNGTAPDNKSDAFKVAYNGDATIGKDLTIKGNTSIGNNLSIKKDLTIYGKLIIKGKEVDSENIEKLELLDGGTLSSKLTADGKGFGFRLSTYLDTNYGNIGDKAVDLSYSDTESDTNGASGKYSLATGLNTTASGHGSTAMGTNTTASGSYSIAMGSETTATGIYSTAMGKNTTASDFGSFVIGQYNDALSEVTTGGFSGQYDTDNTAFVIGNGFVDENNNTVIRSDAFKVGYNGDATIGNDLRVIGDVFISSDVRLKTNIVSLGSTLSKLLLIDGKSFTMKKNGKQKIGVIAQDIQKVFPELVRKDDNEMLAVNYQGLIPILINALKEQNAKISRLEHLIKIK